jgi:hypothetical protein
MNGRRRTRWLTMAVGSALFLLGATTPAAAHDVEALRNLNPSHYNGDDRAHWHAGNEGRTNEAQVASDAFEGVDNLWTMRAVASPEAQYYNWYECNTESDPFDPNTCRLIARDTTPVLSLPPPGGRQVAVFEATWDIRSNLQFGRTFRTLACIDGPPPVSSAHCVGDRTGVHFDDSASGVDHALTDAGHIVQPGHGQAVANAGFTAVAYTSQSDIGRIQFCLDVGTSPWTAENANPSGGCDSGSVRDTAPDDSPVCALVPAGADCWSAQIDPPDNTEFSFGIVEQDDPTGPVESGAGDCEGDTLVGNDGANTGDDCQFDKAYLTSVATPPPPPPPPVPLPGQGAPPVPTACGEGSADPIVGTEGRDTLVGTPEPDAICGLGGNDILRGLGEDDHLIGGTGKDRLMGGAGNDRARGEAGPDILSGGPGRDRCAGGPGRDRFRSCERTPGGLDRRGSGRLAAGAA